MLKGQGRLAMEEQSGNGLGGNTLPTTYDQIEVTVSLPLCDLTALRKGESSMASEAMWRATAVVGRPRWRRHLSSTGGYMQRHTKVTLALELLRP